jgi:hypothetical protein
MVNDCYPLTKLFRLNTFDQWVMGTYDTCKYHGPTRSYVSLPLVWPSFKPTA